MRKIIIIFGILLAVMACKTEDKNIEIQEVKKEVENYISIGDAITADAAKSTSDMTKVYGAMNIGDTITAKMMGKVNEVCQSKGCWMKINLEGGEQVMVKFKDYGFFMPKDSAGKEVVLSGKAYINELSINELRHYAEDAGESSQQIAAIIAPKRTFSFEANGVLLKEE